MALELLDHNHIETLSHDYVEQKKTLFSLSLASNFMWLQPQENQWMVVQGLFCPDLHLQLMMKACRRLMLNLSNFEGYGSNLTVALPSYSSCYMVDDHRNQMISELLHHLNFPKISPHCSWYLNKSITTPTVNQKRKRKRQRKGDKLKKGCINNVIKSSKKTSANTTRVDWSTCFSGKLIEHYATSDQQGTRQWGKLVKREPNN